MALGRMTNTTNMANSNDALDELAFHLLERRDDLYLSTLSHYVEALGGRLEVRAVFSDEEIVVRSHPSRVGSAIHQGG